MATSSRVTVEPATWSERRASRTPGRLVAQPHIVTVTAEPLPSRLAAIARGTGEVDAVYHVALDELVQATDAAGTAEQRMVIDELITQNRLAGFETLVDVLAV